MVRGGPRVLVVDDDLPICELLELAFTEEGWGVRIRTRGEDALDRLQQWTAHVILLDLRLPEMDEEAVRSRRRGRGPVEREMPVLLRPASSSADEGWQPTLLLPVGRIGTIRIADKGRDCSISASGWAVGQACDTRLRRIGCPAPRASAPDP